MLPNTVCSSSRYSPSLYSNFTLFPFPSGPFSLGSLFIFLHSHSPPFSLYFFLSFCPPLSLFPSHFAPSHSVMFSLCSLLMLFPFPFSACFPLTLMFPPHSAPFSLGSLSKYALTLLSCSFPNLLPSHFHAPFSLASFSLS